MVENYTLTLDLMYHITNFKRIKLSGNVFSGQRRSSLLRWGRKGWKVITITGTYEHKIGTFNRGKLWVINNDRKQKRGVMEDIKRKRGCQR